MIPAFLALLLLALGPLAPGGTPHPPGSAAVVRIPSHGGSGTFIATGPGGTYVLTAAHLLEDGGERTPPRCELPAANPSPPIKASPRWLAWDKQRDLALAYLAVEVPTVTPVAPEGWPIAQQLTAVGYDHMRRPFTIAPSSVLTIRGQEIRTREKPNPGRSGGALLDPHGYVVGVCLARVDGPGGGGYGVYASLPSVHAFLREKGYPWLIPQGQPGRVQEYRAPAPAPGHY